MDSNNDSKNKKIKTKQPEYLNNIKSIKILKQIIYNISKVKYLQILKYNRKAQKRLYIDLNTYKLYSEKYSAIEIIIKPDEVELGPFINIPEEEKSFYHIYFNNNKNEKKNMKYKEKIKLMKLKS